MQCENIFCIYWAEKGCSLQEVELDIQGNCKECIYVEIDPDMLKAAREKILLRYKEAAP